MLKKYLFTVLIALSVTSLILIAETSEDNSGFSDISKVENFTLKDYDGKTHKLTDYKDSKAIVLMFIATQCPVSNAYNSRMAELYKNYKGKEVEFIGINSNSTEPVDEIKDHSKKHGLEFVILKDEKNIIADKLNATVTPEIYLLNSNFEILYHGRIDDSRKESNVKDEDLSKALDEVLSGKEVSNPKTVAFGCTIKRVN